MLMNDIKDILKVRFSLNDEDDYSIEQCRENLIQKLSINIDETIFILNQLTDEEILLVSEVFEEISYNLQSKEYIDCLKVIQNKYPDLDLKDSIDVAEDFMD